MNEHEYHIVLQCSTGAGRTYTTRAKTMMVALGRAQAFFSDEDNGEYITANVLNITAYNQLTEQQKELIK